MIKIPQIFFWKCYSQEKLTCTKTFCFVLSTKECICNTQFYELMTPTVHSSTHSLKDPKLREQLFSGKKRSFTHESYFNFKNLSEESDEFEKLIRKKWLIFQKWRNFWLFFSLIRYVTFTLPRRQRHWFNQIVKKNLNKHLPNNVKRQVTFTCQNLSTQFNVKNRNVTYFGNCSEQNCTDN